MRRRTGPTIATMAVAAILVAACGGATGGSAPAPSSDTAVPAGPASAAPVDTQGAAVGGPSNLSLRIANFVAGAGTAAPALDIYDDSLKDASGAVVAAAKPLIANLAFGAVSDYVHPSVPSNGGYLHLYEMPAGSSPAASGGQAPQFYVATNDTAQATLILTWDSETAPTPTKLLSYGSLSVSDVLEKGGGPSFQGESGPPAPEPSAGQALLLAASNWLPQGLNIGGYLMVDDSCAPPLNGDPNEPGVPYIFAADDATPKSAFALFAATPGTHRVAVVSPDPSLSAPTCKDLTERQGEQTVTLTSGEEAYAWVFGTSAKDLHLAIAPIAP